MRSIDLDCLTPSHNGKVKRFLEDSHEHRTGLEGLGRIGQDDPLLREHRPDPALGRRESGYRDYGPSDIHRLAFIRRARDLGFSIDQIRDLLRLWSDPHRSSAEVKAIALEHVAELKQRARQLNEMADALRHLASACEGDHRPECPIIKGLEGQIPLELHCAEGGAPKPRIRNGSGARKPRSATRQGQSAAGP